MIVRVKKNIPEYEKFIPHLGYKSPDAYKEFKEKLDFEQENTYFSLCYCQMLSKQSTCFNTVSIKPTTKIELTSKIQGVMYGFNFKLSSWNDGKLQR